MQRDLDDERFAFFLQRELDAEWTSFLYTGWPQHTVHLPAGRSGIMNSYQVLASAVVRQSVTAGIRPIEIEPLPGTSADFLSLMVGPERRFRGRPKARPRRGGSKRVSSLIRDFEDRLGATIELDKRTNSLDMAVAITPEGKFPLSRTSSMLSELAPILLILKSHIYQGDHITIDEPEAHLHPAMQRAIASFITDMVNYGFQFVLTTHSDFFVGELNNLIRAGQLRGQRATSSIDKRKVYVLLFERDHRWCTGRVLDVDSIDGIDESTFTDVMKSLYEQSVELIDQLID